MLRRWGSMPFLDPVVDDALGPLLRHVEVHRLGALGVGSSDDDDFDVRVQGEERRTEVEDR